MARVGRIKKEGTASTTTVVWFFFCSVVRDTCLSHVLSTRPATILVLNDREDHRVHSTSCSRIGCSGLR